MAGIDRNKVQSYRAEIKDSLNILREIVSGDITLFVRDPLKVRALKYSLIVMVEAICNLSRHMLAKISHVAVEEYMETIIKMGEKGFISEERTKRLVPLIKLRHQLIHGYWKTNDARLFQETKDNLSEVESFIQEIDSIIPKSD